MSQFFDDGLEMRRATLGAAWVDPQLERAKEDDFVDTIQKHVTEYCWGMVWTREGLDRKTRSMLTLAILTTLGKMTELKGHVRGAINNGCTVEEIREVLLHATVYAGVPAGVDAFRNAREALDAMK